MTLITVLLVFILGLSFASWGMPFLDSLFTTITIWFQMLQGKLAVKIAEDQVKVAKLTEKEDKEKLSAIGFTVPLNEEEECYEND